MEPLVAASVFTASPACVFVAGGVLSVLALAATGLVLRGTAAERETRLLASGRVVCASVTGLLAAAGFLGLLTRWALAVGCVAFLLAVLAVALRYGQGTSLRGYLEARGGEDVPAWWPAFEHGFRRYTSTPRREQNPLRRAITRPTSQTADADRGRVARRPPPDVLTGGRP
jgi:hypothetical protein